MNKEYLLQLIKLLKDKPQDISNDDIVESLKIILLPSPSIKGSVKHSWGNTPILNKCISPMGHFLECFDKNVAMVDSSQIGIEFAIEYVESLQDFAQKTNAEDIVISEINELLEHLK